MGILYQLQAGVDIACCFRAWITGAIGAMGGNIMISGIRHRLESAEGGTDAHIFGKLETMAHGTTRHSSRSWGCLWEAMLYCFGANAYG